MRRLTRLAAVIGLAVGTLLVATDAVSAAPAACQQYDSHGVCIVQAESPGTSSSPQQPGTAAPASSSAVPVCTDSASGTTVPCQGDAGWWVQQLQCYAQVMTVQPPLESPVWGGHTDGAIYLCTFYTGGGAFPGTSGFSFWSADPPVGPPAVDPAVLAAQALQALTIPIPTTGMYPAGELDNGAPYTVVNAYTWFWTDTSSFQPLSSRADAGGVWAQVEVVPTGLSFTPGDGGAVATCAGPGTAWQPADGVWAPSPSGCDYRYPHSSIRQPDGQVTATYAIQWSVSWTASTGATGTLPQVTTSSNATFAVAEAQSVVTR